MNRIKALDYNQRVIHKILPRISLINKTVKSLKHLSDAEICDLYYQRGDRASSNTILALISIGATRVLKQTPYDVQLIGSILLGSQNIVEMSTGEGKTLVAAITALHNIAFVGEASIHIITVNDYLVTRDYQQMKPLYDFFKVSSGYIVSEMNPDIRKTNYSSNIIYATSSELGFDYLRDSLAVYADEIVQGPFCRAIVDEADSNMLDEANTPLVISSQTDDSGEGFIIFNDIVASVINLSDVRIDKKDNQCYLLDSGFNKIEQEALARGVISNPSELYEENSKSIFYINCCVQAHFIYLRDHQYLVRNNEVVIISDKTGRAMSGRRWSDGIHQAIEAKERLEVLGDSKTLATITLQNFFKSYPNLSGMTGTALTDSIEFNVVYKLNTVRTPTNKPCIRIQHKDLVFVSVAGKRKAIINKIKECIAKYQPVLVGTTTVEDSEALSLLLTRSNISHQVLNARLHEQEAFIISQAGAPGQVTIATNMAGRGTDIILGGRDVNLDLLSPQDRDKIMYKHSEDRKKVINAGGLFVIASDKHNLRRIDNQLIGRCARQGEPGESQFYISLEDELIKHFIDVTTLDLESLTDDDSLPIESPVFPIHKFILNAQKMLESRSFEGRRDLMKYDDIVNDKRQIYLALHNKLLNYNFDIITYVDNIFRDVSIDPYGQMQLQRILESNDLQELFYEPQSQELFYEFYLSIRNQVGTIRNQLGAFERRMLTTCLIKSWQEYINYIPNIKLNSSLMSHAQKEPLDVFEKEVNESFDKIFIMYKVMSILSIMSLWTENIKGKHEL
jgi:preprotein translocase subunit SecA